MNAVIVVIITYYTNKAKEAVKIYEIKEGKDSIPLLR
jgi:hypothetical protein